MDVILREPSNVSTRDVVLYAAGEVGGTATVYERTAAEALAVPAQSQRMIMGYSRVGSDEAVLQDTSIQRASFARLAADGCAEVNDLGTVRTLDAGRVVTGPAALTDTALRSLAAWRSSSAAVTSSETPTFVLTFGRTASDALPRPDDSASRSAVSRRTAGAVASASALVARTAAYLRKVDQSAPAPLMDPAHTRFHQFYAEASESVAEPVAQTLRQVSFPRAAGEVSSLPTGTTTRVLAYWRELTHDVPDLGAAVARRASYLRAALTETTFTVEALYRRLSGRRPVRIAVEVTGAADLGVSFGEHLG